MAAHTITMIDLAHPCTACLITDNLLRESLAKVQKQVENVEVEIVVLEHPRELSRYGGVEVERLPILLIDGEQVSAGSFLTPRQIIAMLNE